MLKVPEQEDELDISYHNGYYDGQDALREKFKNDLKLWTEFEETGLLWFVNMILHLFGWAIYMERGEQGIMRAWPMRTKFRGFPENINSIGYERVSRYLKKNIKDIYKDAR